MTAVLSVCRGPSDRLPVHRPLPGGPSELACTLRQVQELAAEAQPGKAPEPNGPRDV
jgi:hypothetical protein